MNHQFPRCWGSNPRLSPKPKLCGLGYHTQTLPCHISSLVYLPALTWEFSEGVLVFVAPESVMLPPGTGQEQGDDEGLMRKEQVKKAHFKKSGPGDGGGALLTEHLINQTWQYPTNASTREGRNRGTGIQGCPWL